MHESLLLADDSSVDEGDRSYDNDNDDDDNCNKNSGNGNGNGNGKGKGNGGNGRCLKHIQKDTVRAWVAQKLVNVTFYKFFDVQFENISGDYWQRHVIVNECLNKKLLV